MHIPYTKDELYNATDLQLINTRNYYDSLLQAIEDGLINDETAKEIELHFEELQKELDRRYK